MQNFYIVRKSDIAKTYRVAHIMSDFDVDIEHANEHFVGEIVMPEKWNIGVICGGSGTGKSTIATELFGDNLITQFEYSAKSVIDDMPPKCTMEEIEKTFYAVGFGSVPSWLKPYAVLSNGEKMRVDLARAILENDFFVFDEFTSVVDRQVAQTACIAIEKSIRKNNKQFVAVSCHDDILEWLQPDWVLDTNTMKSFFMSAHDLKKDLKSENVGVKNGESLAGIII